MSKEMMVERQQRGDSVMRALYELSRGRLDGMYTMAQVAARAGLSDADAEDGFEFLERMYFAESLTSDYVNITAHGIEEYERLFLKPVTPAEVATTQVSQHFYAPVGVVQTGPDAHANVHQGVGVSAQELVALLDKLAADVPVQRPEQREEAIGLIADLRAEAIAPEPKAFRLKAFSSALGAILVGAAGTLLAEYVQRLLAG